MTDEARSPRPRRPGVALALFVCGLAWCLPGCSDASPEARIDDTMRRVEDIRGLRREAVVEHRFIDRSAAVADLAADLEDVEASGRLEAEERILEHLGLLPPGTDLAALYSGALGSDVLGYYDPVTKVISVIDDDGEVEADDLLVLAHEHAHALQDQHFDLASRYASLQDDALAAHKALVEGEATLVMALWAVRRLGKADLEELSPDDVPRDATFDSPVPPVLAREGEFPYLDGAAFVYRTWEPGGWTAVDTVWEQPPASTEQVMHPERYPDDMPVRVVLPDVAARLGSGWSVIGERTLGEMFIGVLLADGEPWAADDDDLFAYPVLARAWAAEGWGGDRLVALEGPDGSWAIAWQTSWDRRVDAAEFTKATGFALDDLPGTWSVMAGRNIAAGYLPNPVLVLLADGEATHAALARAATIAGWLGPSAPAPGTPT